MQHNKRYVWQTDSLLAQSLCCQLIYAGVVFSVSTIKKEGKDKHEEWFFNLPKTKLATSMLGAFIAGTGNTILYTQGGTIPDEAKQIWPVKS